MKHKYINNHLHLIDQNHSYSVYELVDQLDSPFYIYHLQGILDRVSLFQEVVPGRAHYAMKANDNPFLLKKIAEKNMGVDIVSLGELKKALEAGFQPQNIVFSGVGKTKSEISEAIKVQIKQINVESPQELIRVAEIAKSLNQKANVALRMNPDVNPQTHPYIRTGFRDNKFGMDMSFLPQLENILDQQADHLILQGLTLHIGSQIREVDPFLDSVKKTIPIYLQLKEKYPSMHTFDVGGGVGMDYEKGNDESDEALLKEYGEKMKELFTGIDCEVISEPGRILVGRYGWLLSEIQYIKQTPYKSFAIINTGMHHLMRPCLYQAYHRVIPVKENKNSAKKLYDVVGPICESSDVIGHERLLPELHQGDHLVIADTGAYGAVMASNYNSHELPREYFYYQGQILDQRGEAIQ